MSKVFLFKVLTINLSPCKGLTSYFIHRKFANYLFDAIANNGK